MPFHRIYHTPGTFSVEDKRALAKQITDFYVSVVGLAPFYIVVNFIPIQEEDFFVSGKPNTEHFVRLVVQHLRLLAWDIQKQRFMEAYEAILAPFIKDRGYDSETIVEEGDTNMWRESGLQPPLPGSAAEKEWVRLNKAVPYAPEQNQP